MHAGRQVSTGLAPAAWPLSSSWAAGGVSGTVWSPSTERNRSTRSSPRSARMSPSSPRTWSSFGDGARERVVLRGCGCRGRGSSTQDRRVGARTGRSCPGRRARSGPPREATPGCSPRDEPRHELVDGRRRVAMARRAPRAAHRATAWRGRALSGEGRLVRPATTPCSLTANHVPPASSSRPPRMRGRAWRRTVMRTRRAVEPFVAVGADHERCPGVESRHHHEQAHRGQGSGGLTRRRRSAN